MACYTMRIPQQTPEEREAEIADAVMDLERQIQAGIVSVVIDPASGAVAFVNWDGAGLDPMRRPSDVCAFHALTVQGSIALAEAIEMAEMNAGRSLDMAAMSAGIHSHDGVSWGRH